MVASWAADAALAAVVVEFCEAGKGKLLLNGALCVGCRVGAWSVCNRLFKVFEDSCSMCFRDVVGLEVKVETEFVEG